MDTLAPTADTLTPDAGAGSRAAMPDRRGEAATGRIAVSVIMPTTFWTGSFDRCARRVLACIDASRISAEAIFVLDGAPQPRPAWLDHPAARILTTGSRSGPAVARNRAASAARGDLLFFVDADVELSPDSIDRVANSFAGDGDLVALFGAYDDEPAALGAASQFRNLLHHHVHVTHPGAAVTFWSGCGAIRASTFADAGGFDESFSVPSVEDVELGMRIAADGGRIVLDPGLRCKHLKPWTLVSMTYNDIVHRATPWTKLIVSRHEMPAALNIDWAGRISGVCAVLLAVCLPAVFLVPAAAWAVLACVGALVAINGRFYSLCLRKQGIGFAIASVAMHWLFFLYSSVTFGVLVIHGLLFGRGRPGRHRPGVVSGP